MKIEKRVREYDVFIANDDTEHKTKIACEDYEREQINLLEAEKLKVLSGYAPFDGEENYSDSNYTWYKVQTDAEVDIINNAFGEEIFYINYPNYICIEISDSGEVLTTTSLDTCIEYASRLLTKLGFSANLHKFILANMRKD